jgi:hypothetical protein
MAEKRFGVDIRLIKEFRFCQLNRKKRKMFERRAIVSLNNGDETEMTIKASYRRLTLTPSVISNCCPPVQVIAEIDETTVEIVRHLMLCKNQVLQRRRQK